MAKYDQRHNENIDNWMQIREDYISAYEMRKKKIDSLYDEAKVIKKLKLYHA